MEHSTERESGFGAPALFCTTKSPSLSLCRGGFVANFPTVYLPPANDITLGNRSGRDRPRRAAPANPATDPTMPNRLLRHMVLILALLSITAIATAQSQGGLAMPDDGPYRSEWAQIDSLTRAGLPRSALDIATRIYDSARGNGDAPQVVKAQLAMRTLRASFEEDPQAAAIEGLAAAIDAVDPPARQVLQSVLGEYYLDYYRSNQWRLRDRTAGGGSDDLRTWDARRLLETAAGYYRASLQPAGDLQGIPVERFAAILARSDSDRELRPTLYDLLAHRAIAFFASGDVTLLEPGTAPALHGDTPFLPAERFVSVAIDAETTPPMKRAALELYQTLLRLHRDRENIAALVDADLHRLEFARREATGGDAERRYGEALTALRETHRNHPASTRVAYALAQWHLDRSRDYQPEPGDDAITDPDHPKWAKKRAWEICEEAGKRFPASAGAKNCRALQLQITSKRLTVESSNVVTPGRDVLLLISYANVSTAHLKLVEIDPDTIRDMRQQRMRVADWLAYLRKRPAAAAWTQPLPDDGDYHAHRLEAPAPALAPGYYALLVSSDGNFDQEKGASGFQFLWSSGIGFVHREDDAGNRSGLFVMDRHSGAPLRDVTAQVWTDSYDRTARRNQLQKGPLRTSDRNGYIDLSGITRANRWEQVYIDLRHDGDRLFLDDRVTLRGPQPEPRRRPQTRTVFFTDRAIYRPGQTVWFKGIVFEEPGDDARGVPLSDHATTVQLLDANRQEVAGLELRTSEFGTVSGHFILPTGGLTGQFTIRNENSSTGIQVEEYKRPRFEVNFDPVTGSFRLGDTVTVSGAAAAFAGSPIAEGTVSWRVERRVFFPYARFGYILPPSRPPVEVARGESGTDGEGRFEIRFPAIPDPRTDLDTQPVFSYVVTADVTDIAGETRSATVTVRVGTVALDLAMTLPERIDRQAPDSLTLSSKNLNGEFEPATGTIRIHALVGPETVLRPRLWDRPDRQALDKSEFRTRFPHDPYDREDDPRFWPAASVVWERTFDTREATAYALADLKDLPEGQYRVTVASRDAWGTAVELQQPFSLYDLSSRAIPGNAFAWHFLDDAPVEPGGAALLTWGSAAPDVHAVLEIFRSGRKPELRYPETDARKAGAAIAVTDSDRGGIRLRLFFVRYNRVSVVEEMVNVPWPDTDLQVRFETFRDRLKPGQEEEWRIRIRGPKGEKVAAELVASLYDASLDAFLPHDWHPYFPSGRHGAPGDGRLDGRTAFNTVSAAASGTNWNPRASVIQPTYDMLDPRFGLGGYGALGGILRRGGAGGNVMQFDAPAMQVKSAATDAAPGAPAEADGEGTYAVRLDDEAAPPPGSSGDEDTGDSPPAAPRRNFAETAFFYPELRTDAEGDVIIAFTIPEALTRWKLLAFAHTTELAHGFARREVVTQKELMVMPNVPRFLREGDRITLTAAIVNMSDNALAGEAELRLFDALSGDPVDARFGLTETEQPFRTEARGNAAIAWELTVPEGLSAVTWRVMASAGDVADGEEAVLPVLTNRMLVTESLPLPVRAGETRTFDFTSLKNAGRSSTLRHQSLTLEFTPNPAWYAVQALPYLMEYPHECSEQIFSRLYANSLAAHIVDGQPAIERVFRRWQEQEPQALQSNLEKNPELKMLLLEETPWVLQARDEAERKRRLALLFDLNRMRYDLDNALRKLDELQLPSGAWPWFAGMRENRYITQYIVTGMGHLAHLGVPIAADNAMAASMLGEAVAFLDAEMARDYRELVDRDADLETMHLSRLTAQYLYARSYFDLPLDEAHKSAFDFWTAQAREYWLQLDLYSQGMIALALHRRGMNDNAGAIVASLRERALQHEEMGMYWREGGGIFWYEAPIETQALMIEVFDEVAGDREAVDEMRLWLLKQKQTQDWKTTRATANACYALLRRGTELLTADADVAITVGETTIRGDDLPAAEREAGTGYFKRAWSGSDVSPAMGDVTVVNGGETPAWGALYWQYFEQLDKIESHMTNLELRKRVYRKGGGETGPALKELSGDDPLTVGDLLVVRIELKVDRALEYVHLKDQRGAGLEPLDVLSGYRGQGSLGYYQSTRDAATHFFFGWLPKGVHVLEYNLRVTHSGDFSNGVTSIQCMYAPEFAAHSEGIRLPVAP